MSRALPAALLCLALAACGGGGDSGAVTDAEPSPNLCDSPDYGRVINGVIVQFASLAAYQANVAAGFDCRVVIYGNTYTPEG